MRLYLQKAPTSQRSTKKHELHKDPRKAPTSHNAIKKHKSQRTPSQTSQSNTLCTHHDLCPQKAQTSHDAVHKKNKQRSTKSTNITKIHKKHEHHITLSTKSTNITRRCPQKEQTNIHKGPPSPTTHTVKHQHGHNHHTPVRNITLTWTHPGSAAENAAVFFFDLHSCTQAHIFSLAFSHSLALDPLFRFLSLPQNAILTLAQSFAPVVLRSQHTDSGGARVRRC